MSNVRREKMEKFREEGVELYPRDFPNRLTISSLLFFYNKFRDFDNSINEYEKKTYRIAGRITARRKQSKNIFLDLVDQTGQIQLHIKLVNCTVCNGTGNVAPLPDGEYTSYDECLDCDGTGKNEFFSRIADLDLGDCIGVEGKITQNPQGEPLLLVEDFVLLAKALLPPPDKFHGVSDDDMRYRHREIDLLSSADSRELFKTRAKIVQLIRNFLNERDFIEIETPILQPLYGGATARPFTTHHNALNQEYYLQISSELYLKRCMVGGFDRVYSLGRCFRNEGLSPRHNPEFTMVEFFQSCVTADDMAKLTQEIISYLCVHTGFSNYDIIPNLISPWKTISYDKDIVSEIDESSLIEPTFVNDLPAEDWPLSRELDGNISADAWELYINGIEIASGATDLNSPDEQRGRFQEKSAQRISENGEDFDEANPYDKNYVTALERGLLPISGVGIGIDRLVMLLTGSLNLRDVIVFPTLRSN